jgi:ectoine hydroxylase-related dioxygenase (phytanoyl-CoA dioxygenase family)
VTAPTFEAALAQAGVTEATLTAAERAALDQDGYVVLRGVYDAAQCARLRETFERTFIPSDQWPMPRGAGTRHAMLDNEKEAWHAALAPRVLAAAHHLLRGRFFLFDVQGRDPKAGQGEQRLHRDWVAPQGPAPIVVVLAFLDPFGAANGATRVVPGTHLLAGGADAFTDTIRHPDEVIVEGEAGDILVCDGYLVHSGTQNVSGAARRDLQIALHAVGIPGHHAPKRDCAGEAPHIRYLLGAEG